jgi:hypothetical protein
MSPKHNSHRKSSITPLDDDDDDDERGGARPGFNDAFVYAIWSTTNIMNMRLK